MKYEFTGYKPGDEKEISKLFSQAFSGRNIDINGWKFVQEHGNADHYCIANLWDKEKLIGHTELLTAKAFYKGESFVSGTSATTMADSGYLGAGAMVYKWIDRTYPDYIKIGFPNENSFPLVLKILKHKYLGEIDFWWKKLQCSIGKNVVEKGCIPSPVREESVRSERLEIRQCERVSDDFDFFSECKSYEYSLLRDRAFLEWRFLGRREKNYQYFECRESEKLTGYMVCSLYRDEDGTLHGQIADIMAKNTVSFQKLLLYAEKHFADMDASIIKLWMTDNNQVNILKDLGFCYGLRPFHVECWHQEIDMEKSYFTMADSDIF